MFEIPVVPAISTDAMYIGGNWVRPRSGETVEVIDSTSGEPFTEIAYGGVCEMDQAIKAAREAFDHGPWSKLDPAERAMYLRKIAQEWRNRSEDVEAVYPREVGALQHVAKQAVERAAIEYELFADYADSFDFEKRIAPTSGGHTGFLIYEGVGVVAAIVPWNSPVTSMAHKIAPALAAGCTVVLRISREAPVEGFIAAEIAEAVGLPEGVLNVVVTDRDAADMLTQDPRVDKIAFTGSTATGQHIGRIGGGRMARMTLELGGKSPALILDDADLQRTATTISAGQCRLTGQVCASLTRVIVDKSIFPEFSALLVDAYKNVKVGNPFDPTSQIGPLSSAGHRESVERYISTGIDEGAELLAGGGRPIGLDQGYYLSPTLFRAPSNRVTIAQEEIFGPVTTMLVADNVDHAIEMANESIYGLNASVFTENADRAFEISKRLQSGTVGQNASRTDFGIAFGGVKQSGIGREGGEEGLRAYLEPKTVVLDDIPTKYL